MAGGRGAVVGLVTDRALAAAYEAWPEAKADLDYAGIDAFKEAFVRGYEAGRDEERERARGLLAAARAVGNKHRFSGDPVLVALLRAVATYETTIGAAS